MLYTERPKDFNPTMEAVGCFVEDYQRKILLLLRDDSRPHPNTWCLPSGKMEKGESPLEAMLREAREETGFCFNPVELGEPRTTYVRYLDKDFVYYIFHAKVGIPIHVTLNSKEHKDYRWVTLREALGKPETLIPDLDECIRLVYPNILPAV
ncbi:MAG: NUDIX hydrolase [Nanoarchaeota archaeon]|nr:NUDIX hydrolase [Nanoarchaeota archaeon]